MNLDLISPRLRKPLGSYWINLVLALLFASVPFYTFGIFVKGYVLNLTFLLIVLLNILLILSLSIDRKKFTVWCMLIVWCLITAIWRWNFQSYGYSLIAFSIVTFPLLIGDLHSIDLSVIIRGAVWGFLLMIPFGVYDILSIFYLVPSITEWLPSEVLRQKGTIGNFSGLLRSRCLFLEPSHYSLYLTAFYVGLDQISFVKIWKYGRVLRIFTVVFLFFTFSLAGYILLFGYIITNYFFEDQSKFTKRIVNSFNGLLVLFVGLGLIFGLGILNYDNFIRVFLFRYNEIHSAIFYGQISGSAGVRIGSAFLPYHYFSGGGVLEWVFGEGYGNYENWLSQYFVIDWSSSLGEGNIHNLFSVMVLSTGAVGVIIYIKFLSKMIAGSWRRSAGLVCLIFLGQFAVGHLVATLYWSTILFPVIINNCLNVQRRSIF